MTPEEPWADAEEPLHPPELPFADSPNSVDLAFGESAPPNPASPTPWPPYSPGANAALAELLQQEEQQEEEQQEEEQEEEEETTTTSRK